MVLLFLVGMLHLLALISIIYFTFSWLNRTKGAVKRAGGLVFGITAILSYTYLTASATMLLQDTIFTKALLLVGAVSVFVLLTGELFSNVKKTALP